MDIVIPTYGRANSQETLRQLRRAGLVPTLIVQTREAVLYSKHDAQLVILPPHIQTIAPTRQWIVDNVGDSDQLVMVDDDLVFYRRRHDDRTKLRDIEPDELAHAFDDMGKHLQDFAHVGFAAREGANRNTDSWMHNTRIMRVLGYDRSVLQSEKLRFDEMDVMEDFHVALCLLERGYDNVVLNEYAHNQGGSGSEGGCSSFRTTELQADNARKLAELHPRFVAVVEKTTVGAWGGGARTDVRVQWKKARESAK